MPTFRLETIHSLARQLAFVPADVRIAQLAAAEALLNDLDLSKSYPNDFVIFRITGYARKGDIESEQSTGLALFHDIGVLIEQTSEALNLVAADQDEPVLSIDDVVERFNVTSKTIQRWRRKGLVSRRFIFSDGKKRVGFLLSSIERFIARHADTVVNQSNLLPLTSAERDALLRAAHRLARSGCTQVDLTHRLARRFNRSPLTILHTLRKHDPSEGGVLLKLRKPMKASRRLKVIRAARRGKSLGAIALRWNRPRATIYRIVMEDRIARVTRRKIRFHDDELYHQPDADCAIESIVQSGRATQSSDDTRPPRGLPPYLADLYRTPLLSRPLERALFLKFHYLKYRFSAARRRFDPETARRRDLHVLERIQRQAMDVKNEIVRSNLRLVVSVARKHLGPVSTARQTTPTLMDLVSEGNIILMRAVESFDIHKDVRFSTYATLALMKGFARIVPELRSRANAARLDSEFEVADVRCDSSLKRIADRDEVRKLLQTLSHAERSVIARQFGIDGQPEPAESMSYERLGVELGISKHRVRALEQSALSKLRSAIHAHV